MKRKTSDAVEILEDMVGSDIKAKERIEEATFNARIAQMIYQARTVKKLTQKQLAELVGTTQPVIARLEDAEYEGHSLSMLRRVAAALNQRIEIRFVAAKEKKRIALSS